MTTTLRNVFYAAIASLPQRALPALPVLLPLLAAIMATACTEAPEAATATAATTPVTMAVSAAAYTAPTASPTRAPLTGVAHAGRTFAAGEQLYAYFPEGVSVGHTVFTTAAPAADVNPATAADPQPLLSAPGGTLPVYAYSPATVTEQTATWTVAQNQATAERYTASDLMTATGTIDAQGRCKNDAVNGSSADALTLQHQMARIVVSVTAPSAALSLSALQLIAGWRTTGLAMPAGTPAGALTDAISPAEPLTVSAAATIDAGDMQQFCCLVPPQRIAQGTPLVRIVTHQGTATYATATAQQLQAGRSYTLAVSVTAVGVTTGIAAWADGGTLTPGESDEDIYEVGGVTFRMVPVQGGAYTTLNGLSVTNGWLSNFWLGETEVTNGLYYAVMGSKPTGQSKDGDEYPVSNVSWNTLTEATTGFIDRLNSMTATQRPAGWVFTLPTEAQWEYAARGGVYTHGYTYAGSDNVDDVAWYSATDGTGGTAGGTVHPVAQKQPNELGLYDMSGNVMENCLDWYNASPAAGSYDNTANFVQSEQGTLTKKVQRGGGWYRIADWCTMTYRANDFPTSFDNRSGLRLALVQPNPVVGDLYFSDGTWGTAADNPGKTPIGIVFSTTTSAADKAMGYTHGYVMALGEANGGAVLTSGWATGTPSTTQMTDVTYNSNVEATQWANITGDMDGLTHCNTALTNAAAAGTTANLLAINAAKSYTPAAPAVSSGWYLPSIGQFYQLAAAFAPTYADKSNWTWRENSDNNRDFYIGTAAGRNAIVNAVNTAMAAAGTYTQLQDNHHYWTSTERKADRCFDLYIGSDQYTLNGPCYKTNNSRYVRPVLAF